MIMSGGKITMKGQCLNNSGGMLVGRSLDLTYKIINGLDGMVHPGLEQAKFTGVESPIGLSLFAGLPKLTELQFIDCPGLSLSEENFLAMDNLLQSGVKVEVSTEEFITGYNERSTGLSGIKLPHNISNTELQELVQVEGLRQQIAAVPGDTTNQVATEFNNIDSTNSSFQVYPDSRNENAPLL